MCDGMTVFSGNANRPLAKKICDQMGIELGRATVGTFSDGEIQVDFEQSVRGLDVFVVQPTCPPVNNNLMELLVMIDALKRASAARITAVLPYYGYARQDRKVSPRAPITSKLVADLITTAGADRVLTMELHAGQIQGFFNIPVDHLFANAVLSKRLIEKGLDGNLLVIVSPDAGGVERTRALAKRLGAGLAIIDKRREAPGIARFMNIIGDVKEKIAVIFDDIVDTAGTLIEAATALELKGAIGVIAVCCHAVLSGEAVAKINKSKIAELLTTDSIPLSATAQSCVKIKVVSVDNLLADAIRRIHNNDSVSAMF
jgi:ribose-phosphate pyrophosphokinase